jgi:hypothetical protein
MKATTLSKFYSLLIPALGMIACIGVGSGAAGLLYDELEEHHPTKVGLLLVLALLGFAGTLFFLFRFLKRIAPKPYPQGHETSLTHDPSSTESLKKSA